MKLTKSNIHIFVLSGILIVNAIFLAYWLSVDTRPLSWDPAAHMTSTIIYYYLLKSGQATFSNLVNVDTYYPPFYHLSAVPFFALGKTPDHATFVNFIYFAILVISVYCIAKELYNKEIAIYSSLFISVFAPVLTMELSFLIELALISLVTLSICFLVKSKGFTDLKYSVLFGISLGIAELTKWTAAIFIIPPAIWIIYQKLRETNTQINDLKLSLKLLTSNVCLNCGKKVERTSKHKNFCSSECFKKWKKSGNNTPLIIKSMIIGLVISTVLCIIVAAPWYMPHFSEVYQRVFVTQQQIGKLEGDPEIFSLESIIYYLNSLLRSLTIFIILPVVLLVYARIRKIIRLKQLALLIVWLVVPYMILTFLMRNKDGRYILPTIPVFAIILAFLIYYAIKNTNLRKAVVGIILVLGIINTATTIPKPAAEDWKIEEIISTIASDLHKNRELVKNGVVVGVIQDHVYINGRTLQYYTYQLGYGFTVINCAYIPEETFYKNFRIFDYIIIKTGSYSSPYKNITDRMYEFFMKHRKEFAKISTFDLPDKSKAIIYRRAT